MPAEQPSTTTVVRITLTVIGVLLLVAAVHAVRQILVLVVVALFLAIGLDPLVRALGRLGLGRGLSVAVVFLVLVLFVAGFVAAVTPPLVRQTQRLATELPRFVENLSTRSDRFGDLDERYDISERLREAVNNLPDVAAGSAGRALSVAGSVGRAFFSILTVLILTVYFMLDLPKLIDGAAKLVPGDRRRRYRSRADTVFTRISGYMVGQLTVSIIAGVISLVVLSVLRVPYSLPLAMWVAISALIPMVGATLGAIPAVIVGFLSSVPQGIGVVVFYALYQQFENYMVAPRVMRRAVDISPAAVVVAALCGATLLGFVGALLAIPVAASIKVLTQEIWLGRPSTT